MAKRKKADEPAKDKVVDYRHRNASRLNIPPAGLAARGEIAREKKVQYAYNPHLVPALRFDGTGGADRIPALLEQAGKRLLTAEESIQEEESPIDGAPETLDTFGGDTESIQSEAQNTEAYLDRMVRLLREDGVRFPDNKVVKFNTLEALADGSLLHAQGVWGQEGESERRVGDDDRAKHQAARRWVDAVNNWGRLGRWNFLECLDPQLVPQQLRAVVKKEQRCSSCRPFEGEDPCP